MSARIQVTFKLHSRDLVLYTHQQSSISASQMNEAVEWIGDRVSKGESVVLFNTDGDMTVVPATVFASNAYTLRVISNCQKEDPPFPAPSRGY